MSKLSGSICGTWRFVWIYLYCSCKVGSLYRKYPAPAQCECLIQLSPIFHLQCLVWEDEQNASPVFGTYKALPGPSAPSPVRIRKIAEIAQLRIINFCSSAGTLLG